MDPRLMPTLRDPPALSSEQGAWIIAVQSQKIQCIGIRVHLYDNLRPLMHKVKRNPIQANIEEKDIKIEIKMARKADVKRD
jgi:hypothetical protein